MTETEENLGGLLRPEELRKLADARTHLKPFLATGRRDRLSGYFAIDEFADLVNQTGVWAPDRLEVILDTKKVPPQNFFAQLPLQTGTRFRLENAKLQKLLDRGASIVLNDIDSLTPGLKRLRTTIASFTGGRVEGNLYYSQPRHRAFSLHFDVHDVYAFQVAGEKRWAVYQQTCRHPINHRAFLSADAAHHEKNKGAVSLDITMSPGDFLYLPAGYYHQAICTNRSSAHLSFSSRELTGLDVVSEIFDRAVLEEVFRTPVARRMGGGERPVADYLKLLAENIETLMSDEKFVKSIESRLRSYPFPADEVALKEEWGA